MVSIWSLQESGESYLEKAEKMYSQMCSTREKVRAALVGGKGVERHFVLRQILPGLLWQQSCSSGRCAELGWGNKSWNPLMVSEGLQLLEGR